MTGYIYSISAGDFVKIGYSKDPTRRLKQIATGCPTEPKIIAMCKGTLKQEKTIHALLSGLVCHSSGEWYEKSGIKDVIACLKFHDVAKAIIHAEQISLCTASKGDVRGRKSATVEFCMKDCCWSVWETECEQGYQRLSMLEKHIKLRHGFSRREARAIVSRFKDKLMQGQTPSAVSVHECSEKSAAY
jgi:hypothetical protein